MGANNLSAIIAHGYTLLRSNGLSFALIAAFVLSAVAHPVILAPSNLLNILVQASTIGIIALGMLIVMVLGKIDLSVGAVAALSGVVSASCIEAGVSEEIALLSACLACGLCGLMVGTSVVIFRVPAFIASLGVMGIARGCALIISDARPVPITGSLANVFGSSSLLGIPTSILMLGFCSISLHIFLSRSTAGLRMYATGSNEQAAWIMGIPIGRYVVFGHVACALLAGLSGIVLAGRLSSAQPLAGNLYELDAITAVVVGGGALSGGRGNVPGTLVGVLLLSSVRNAMVIMDLSPYYHPIVLGLILVAALIGDDIRQRDVRSKKGGTL